MVSEARGFAATWVRHGKGWENALPSLHSHEHADLYRRQGEGKLQHEVTNFSESTREKHEDLYRLVWTHSRRRASRSGRRSRTATEPGVSRYSTLAQTQEGRGEQNAGAWTRCTFTPLTAGAHDTTARVVVYAALLRVVKACYASRFSTYGAAGVTRHSTMHAKQK